MGIFHHILSTVTGAAESLLGINQDITNPLSEILGGNNTSLGTLFSDVTSSLGSTLSSGFNAIAGTVNDVVSSINGVVSSVKDTIDPVISGIHDVITPIAKLANDINDNLVKPIVDTVNITYGAVNNLINELHNDISEGVKGLLKFPQQLADGLSNVDAQFSRAVQQLGISNQTIASSVLAPAIGDAGAKGFGALNDILGGTFRRMYDTVGKFGRISISEANPLTPEDLGFADWISQVKDQTGFWGDFFRFLQDLVVFGPFVLEGIEPVITAYRQRINSKEPLDLLGLGDIVVALYRGILSQSDAEAEALRRGLSPSKFKVLVENQGWLPSPGEALRLLYRHSVGVDDFETILKEQGFTDDDIKAWQEAFLEPVAPAEAIRTGARRQSATQGFLAASLMSTPPLDIAQLYEPRFADPHRADFDWANHWDIGEMDWWLTAYYKGLRTRTEVELAAQAHMVAPEIIGDLIQVWGETIQLWMIPDMLAVGVFSEAQARDYLHYIGMDDPSIAPIMRFGQAKAKAPKATMASALKQISEANALEMYDDGIIDRALYINVLVAHGDDPQVAELMAELADQKRALAQRKATATDIIDKVKLGTLDAQTAITQLYSLGYTQTEVDTYANEIKTQLIAKTRFPTEAQLDELYKKDIISKEIWTSAMGVLGYQDAWIEALFKLLPARGP